MFFLLPNCCALVPPLPLLPSHPAPQVDQKYENELSTIEVSQKILFHVEHASQHGDRSLSRHITEAVESAIQSSTSNGAEDVVAGIPRVAVDSAIRSHYQARRKTSLYTLYLVHPGAQSRYKYIHDTLVSAAVPPSGTQAGLGTTFPDGCSYVGWVGEHERYVWLDLGADVSSGWGPRSRSIGVVSRLTLPDMSAAALSMREERSYDWLYPQLSALALRTATQLMAPPVLFTPAGLREDLQPWPYPVSTKNSANYTTVEPGTEPREIVVVNLFLVCDPAPCPPEETQAWANLQGLLQDTGANSDAEASFPSVTVLVEEVELLKSPLLATGLQQAMRASQWSTTLASKELRYWLRQFIDARPTQYHGSKRNEANTEKVRRGIARTIPLFVISIGTDAPILLDNSMRSTVFPDMVISVAGSRTGTVRIDSGFECANRTVIFPDHADDGSRGLLRETVASLTQAIWGAPPRTLVWDPLTNGFGTDYLWATGANIQSPLSSHASLTFPERDAYIRTHVLVRVNAAIRAARIVLEQAAAVEPVLANALNAGDYALADSHWSGVKYNLENCLHDLAMHRERGAIEHARELEANVGELGRTLSNGYGNGVHRASCSCVQRDDWRGAGGGEGLGGRWRSFGVSKMFIDALFAAAAVFAVLAMLCKYMYPLGGWNKHKRN